MLTKGSNRVMDNNNMMEVHSDHNGNKNLQLNTYFFVVLNNKIQKQPQNRINMDSYIFRFYFVSI